uniref:Cytokine receptor common subunit gamma n=1 Tax=Pogona vitticeps TaxID=103695 RepID=A0A6J0TVH0_9SAUR
MGAAQRPRRWLSLLLLLCLSPGGPGAHSSAPKVDCIVFNEDYMTCDWGRQQTPMVSYSFYSRFSHTQLEECQDYFQRDGIRVGCRLNITFNSETLFYKLYIHLNSSHTNTSYNDTVELLSRVQVGAPFNLSVKALENNQLRLSWNTPYRNPRCLEHAVEYRSNKDVNFTTQKTEEMNFNVASVDPEKRYTFYVRSKMKLLCSFTELWSEPGGPIYWGKETAPSMPFLLQISLLLASFFLLILLVLILLRMERVRLVLMPAIPNPSKKFEDLFTAYHGNFSEWAGVSKDALDMFKPSYHESICRVSELFPGGGYLPVSLDAGGKAAGGLGTSAGPSPSPTANLV